MMAQSWTKFAPEGSPALKNVYSITAGLDSTIWFGTDYGLFRYKEKPPLKNMPYKKEKRINVYPNPFTDWLIIKEK